MKVKLFSKAGALLHEEEIPVEEPPDALYWGLSVFVLPSLDGAVGRRVSRETDDAQAYEQASVYPLASWPQGEGRRIEIPDAGSPASKGVD
jgi:hypothetical protein